MGNTVARPGQRWQPRLRLPEGQHPACVGTERHDAGVGFGDGAHGHWLPQSAFADAGTVELVAITACLGTVVRSSAGLGRLRPLARGFSPARADGRARDHPDEGGREGPSISLQTAVGAGAVPLHATHLVGGAIGRCRQLDAVGEHLQQSLTVADAREAPFERALTLRALARPRMARAKPEEARALLAEVRAICARREAKPTRERVAALEQRLAKAGAADA